MAVDPQLQRQLFSGPIPGQSWTTPPKSMPWENPPQFVKLDDAMHYLITTMLEPEHLKVLLGMMDGGMSLEAICRTILFTGFASGKWTPDLGMLMYKPLMLMLIAFAHKAGMKHTPVVIKENMDKFLNGRLKQHMMFTEAKDAAKPKTQKQQAVNELQSDTNSGFMRRQG